MLATDKNATATMTNDTKEFIALVSFGVKVPEPFRINPTPGSVNPTFVFGFDPRQEVPDPDAPEKMIRATEILKRYRSNDYLNANPDAPIAKLRIALESYQRAARHMQSQNCLVQVVTGGVLKDVTFHRPSKSIADVPILVKKGSGYWLVHRKQDAGESFHA